LTHNQLGGFSCSGPLFPTQSNQYVDNSQETAFDEIVSSNLNWGKSWYKGQGGSKSE